MTRERITKQPNPNEKAERRRHPQRRTPLLPELLRRQRKQAGLTRAELARRAGVPEKTIQQAETGVGGNISFRDLYAIGLAMGASMAFSPESEPKPPVAMEDILRDFDQLLESKRAEVFVRQQPDREHPSIRWDIVGDPQRNWLYVVASNPARNFRCAAMTDEPGSWSIAGQIFGMDAETKAVAAELSERLIREHKMRLLAAH